MLLFVIDYMFMSQRNTISGTHEMLQCERCGGIALQQCEQARQREEQKIAVEKAAKNARKKARKPKKTSKAKKSSKKSKQRVCGCTQWYLFARLELCKNDRVCV